MPQVKARFDSVRIESVRKDAECTFGTQEKKCILKNHMLIQSKARINNIVFTCAVLHNMLIAHEAHDEWGDEDGNYNIAADLSLDPCMDLRQGQ